MIVRVELASKISMPFSWAIFSKLGRGPVGTNTVWKSYFLSCSPVFEGETRVAAAIWSQACELISDGILPRGSSLPGLIVWVPSVNCRWVVGRKLGVFRN